MAFFKSTSVKMALWLSTDDTQQWKSLSAWECVCYPVVFLSLSPSYRTFRDVPTSFTNDTWFSLTSDYTGKCNLFHAEWKRPCSSFPSESECEWVQEKRRQTEVPFHSPWAGTYRYWDLDLGRKPITNQTPLGYASPRKLHPIPSVGAPHFPAVDSTHRWQ